MTSLELIPMAEKILKQPSIVTVWLLLVTLIKVYNEKEQDEHGKNI